MLAAGNVINSDQQTDVFQGRGLPWARGDSQVLGLFCAGMSLPWARGPCTAQQLGAKKKVGRKCPQLNPGSSCLDWLPVAVDETPLIFDFGQVLCAKNLSSVISIEGGLR